MRFSTIWPHRGEWSRCGCRASRTVAQSFGISFPANKLVAGGGVALEEAIPSGGERPVAASAPLGAGGHADACTSAAPSGSVSGPHAGMSDTKLTWVPSEVIMYRQVGLERSSALTHWVTTTCFRGLLPIPSFRAYLGASSGVLGTPP